MFSSSKTIPNSIRKGSISRSTSAPLASNYSSLIKPKQGKELKESTESIESIIAGADKVLKAIEKWQSSPEYIKVSKIDAKHPGYMHLYYNASEQTRLRVERELNIDVDSV
jgi:hypothetical protein